MKKRDDDTALDPAQLAALRLSLTDEEWTRLRTALIDRACGTRVFTRYRKAGYMPDGTERWMIVSGPDDEADFEGYVYHPPGDPVAQRLIVEHNAGRPAQRVQQRQDANIWIMHRVPGHSNVLPEGHPGPDEPVEEPRDRLMIGGEEVGVEACLEPEPLDTREDDEPDLASHS